MNRMDDLISRKWLMECVNEGWIKFDTEKDKNTYVHLVRDIAPSAQPEPQWIPCSERLPKSGTYCLFTVFEHDSELEATTIETVYGCFEDYGERRYWSWEDKFGECCIKGEEQLDGDHDEIIEKVLAWMPLPEPYDAESEDKK